MKEREETKRGYFITLEGPEGGGKTTQARRLVARLNSRGREVIYTREPGGTPTGEAIRGILQHDATGEPLCAESEVLLFAASRAQLVSRVIKPALKRGGYVVCDRFYDSTTAYQGYGRGFPIEDMRRINNFAVAGCHPNLTLLLSLTPEEGFKRLALRGEELDRMEREERVFHQRVYEGYLKMAAAESERFSVVDASQDPDQVEEAILRIIRDRLKI